MNSSMSGNASMNEGATLRHLGRISTVDRDRPARHEVIRDPGRVVAAPRVGVAARKLAYPSLIVRHPCLLSSRLELFDASALLRGRSRDNSGVCQRARMSLDQPRR
jgi:hypothetical protein